MSKFPSNLPIVYINRDKDIGRREYMERQLESLGITNAVRFPAFSGELTQADPGFRTEINVTRANVLRAIASHLWAIRDLDFKDSPYALILEDDVYLSTCLNWDFTFDEFINGLPKGWDVIQLYLNPHKKRAPEYLNIRPYRPTHISTVAYLITKERAQEVVKEWFRVGVPDLTKATEKYAGVLTDHVIYTEKSYGVNLFSTKDFVSTILMITPGRFHETSGEVIRLWEQSPLSLEDLLKDPYTKTLPQ